MIIFVTFLYFFVNTCSARPDVNIVPQNVVTAPTNCPVGQEWINGQCRDVWRVTAAPANAITVPTNCPPGQEYVNGACRDVWFKTLNGEPKSSNIELDGPRNAVTVPPNCKPGQQWVNGSCRDVWRSVTDTKNVIQVPPNCPADQEYINGQCREVWRSLKLIGNYNNGFRSLLSRKERQLDQEELKEVDPNRNVISVPNQCPAGYRPDALGICREIMT